MFCQQVVVGGTPGNRGEALTCETWTGRMHRRSIALPADSEKMAKSDRMAELVYGWLITEFKGAVPFFVE